MSFAAGMGAGIAAGIAAGMAIGQTAGRKKVGDDLQKYIEQNNFTIQNDSGEVIPTEMFVGEVLNTPVEKNQKIILVLTFVLGLILLLGTAVVYFLASG
jgi:hypothetical protein